MKPYFLKKDGTPWIDLSLLYPPFLTRLEALLDACAAQGHVYVTTKGTRTYAEQQKLYDAYVDKTGTKAAPPGKSQHQFGCAVDLVLDADPNKPGLQADYRSSAYSFIIAEIPKHGLNSGHSFNDDPHVGIPKYVSGSDLAPLRSIYTAMIGDDRNKLKAVWYYLDTKANLWT